MLDLPAHSVYGASSAHRWTACPGSVAATALLPETPSRYAQEGTACHTVAALCLNEGQDAIEYVGRIVEGIEIEEEHAIAVQVYLDAIRNDKGKRGKQLVEKKFHIKELHPQFFGTADCVRWGGGDTVLRVYDAKFGKGEIVEVMRPDRKPNLQLAFYALGAIYELGRVTDVIKGIHYVELVVVQPRAWHRNGPVRRATFTVEEIFAVGDELLAAVQACEEPDPPLIPGPHCKFCRAAGTCPALRNRSLAIANLEFSDDAHMDIKGTVPSPTSLTPEQIANVLYAADELETWMTAVRAHAHALAEQGERIPGWKLVAKQGRRKWLDERIAAGVLIYDFGVDQNLYDVKLKSPAQIEKLMSAKDRKSKDFTDLCPSVSSGQVLVQDSNPRPEVVPLKVAYDDGTSTAESTEW